MRITHACRAVCAFRPSGAAQARRPGWGVRTMVVRDGLAGPSQAVQGGLGLLTNA